MRRQSLVAGVAALALLWMTVAAAQTDAPPITPENAGALTIAQTLSGHDQTINDVAFSPDGTQLASASDDITARLWDVTTGDSLWTLEGQLIQVRSVAFSPNGNTILTTGFNNAGFLWDVRSRTRGQSIEALAAFNDGIFSPDGETVAIAIGDGTVRLYPVDRLDTNRALTAPDTLQITAIAYHPDGERIAGGTGFPTDSVFVWEVAGGEVIAQLTGHAGTVQGVAYAPDGGQVASVGEDGQLIVWDADAGEPVYTVEGAHDGGAFDVAYNSDGDVIATVGFDGTLRLWDAAEGGLLDTYIGDGERSLLAVAFSPDGAAIATAGEPGVIDVWRVTE